MEEERRALAAFVTKFDSLGLKIPSTKLQPPKPTPGGALTAYAERRQSKFTSSSLSDGFLNSGTTKSLNTPYNKGNNANTTTNNAAEETSPIRPTLFKSQPRLLDQVMPEEADMSFDEFEVEQLLNSSVVGKTMGGGGGKMMATNARDVFGDKENILPE